MRPIFTTVGDQLDVVIIPNTKVVLDGHPVLTHSYHIYKDKFNGTGEYIDRSGATPGDREKDPDHLGSVTLEVPGKAFNYLPGRQSRLSAEELEEVQDIIKYYRDTPGLWVTE